MTEKSNTTFYPNITAFSQAFGVYFNKKRRQKDAKKKYVSRWKVFVLQKVISSTGFEKQSHIFMCEAESDLCPPLFETAKFFVIMRKQRCTTAKKK
jgi:hypothetical protein